MVSVRSGRAAPKRKIDLSISQETAQYILSVIGEGAAERRPEWLAIGVTAIRRGQRVGEVYLRSPDGELERIAARSRRVRDL